MNAVIPPRVTCDLPSQHIPLKCEWNHLADLTFANPDFGRPSKIDLLLGVDLFSEVVRHGWRYGAPGSPPPPPLHLKLNLDGYLLVLPTHMFLTCHSSCTTLQ